MRDECAVMHVRKTPWKEGQVIMELQEAERWSRVSQAMAAGAI